MKIRLLHAADLHLDSPMRGVPLKPGEQPPTLRAFTRLIDCALAEKVDAVLLAGDLYDKKDESIAARLHLRNQLQRLHAAGIASFLVHGNHDWLSPDDVRKLPSSTVLFGATHSEVRIETKAGPLRVQGISHTRVDTAENLAELFGRTSEEPTVGLLHANVTSTVGHANYAPCSIDDLSQADLDYWALGHVHTRATFSLRGFGLAAYPGNSQGRHINEAGERGALLVEIDSHRKVSPTCRFVACDVLRWQRCEIDVSTVDAVETLIDLCVAKLNEYADAAAMPVAVRLTLTGTWTASFAIDTDETLTHVEQALVSQLPTQVRLESLVNQAQSASTLEVSGEQGALFQMLQQAASNRIPEAMQRAIDENVLQVISRALKKVRLEALLVSSPQLTQLGLVQALRRMQAGED
jgi:DNA repair protein SbcD/Mre11